MSAIIANCAITASMYWTQYRLRRPLLKASRQVEKSQLKLLQKILRTNSDTEFGHQYNFSKIETLQDYRAQVPVQTYDSLEPYIQRQINGVPALTNDPPKYYARTSGTTGGHKDIPLTENGLRQVKHAQKQLALSLWKDTDFLKGSILGFASAANEGQMANGCKYGSVSGSTHKSVSPIVASKFVAPSSVFSMQDVDAKYQAYALAVLASDNLTGIVAANPSSILKLVKLIDQHSAEMLQVLSGNSSDWLLPECTAILPEILKRSTKGNLAKLQHNFSAYNKLTPDDVFPTLSTIATWTGGSCGIALRQLKPYLPQVKIVEFGYGASEFMGSVNVDAKNNHCLPQLTHHVYEFVARKDWESGSTVFRGAHELTVGEEYYVFVTTQSGLYRYNINDIVRADKPVENCATITFLQKGRGVTNITGEKLSEYQLIDAMRETISHFNLNAGGYMALANEEKHRYDIYLELDNAPDNFATVVDNKLRAMNIEYDDKRSSERLRGVKIHYLSNGACEEIKHWCVAGGVREAQYKPTILAYARDWQDKLTTLIAPK